MPDNPEADSPSRPELGEDGCIVEGLVTTLDENGVVNLAPMGPIVGPTWDVLVLRPFSGSRTYANLLRERSGVFHVTDDVGLIASAAVGRPNPFPDFLPCQVLPGAILSSACRWYAFRIVEMQPAEPRPRWTAQVLDRGVQRDFLGFNRARHAVIEAAILATRSALLSAATIAEELERLSPLVEKTGSLSDRHAFALLCDYLKFQRR